MLSYLALAAFFASTSPSAPPTTPAVIHNVRELTDAPNLKPLTGKTVKLSAIEVLAVEGPRGLWIGTPDHSIFVLSGANLTVKPKEKISLTGVLSPAPSDKEFLEWRVSPEAKARITKEGYYVLAAITPVSELRASKK